MMLYCLKALILLWPFLKRAIFKEESAKDFLLKNKQFVSMLLIVIIISFLFLHLLFSYNTLKREYSTLQICVSSEVIGEDV